MENTGNSVAQKASNPWQDRGSIGFFKALWGTIKYVLLKPGEFFDNLDIQKPIREPFLFYLAISLCTGIIAAAIEILLKPKEGGPFVFIFAGLFILLFTLIGIFIGAGFSHLGVMILGGKGGFKGAFNVLAYNASTSIFLIIPFIGWVISGIWGIVLVVKGFKRVHNLSTIRAIIAYFGIFLIIAFIAILAAIAVPNILRARWAANEAMAKATVRNISTAIETYATVNNGKYPVSEYGLVHVKPAYLSRTYDNKEIAGYRYSLEFNTNSYKIVAKPESCGTTGTKIIAVETSGVIQEKDCK